MRRSAIVRSPNPGGMRRSHSSGTGIFAEETAALLDLHLAQIEEAYRRYLEALTTTYVAELHVMKQDAIGEMGLLNKGAAK